MEIYNVLQLLRHKLKDNGRICLTSLTDDLNNNEYIISSFVISLWKIISRLCPICMGGCRPIKLKHYISNTHGFDIIFHDIISMFGLPSEVAIAKRVSK